MYMRIMLQADSDIFWAMLKRQRRVSKGSTMNTFVVVEDDYPHRIRGVYSSEEKAGAAVDALKTDTPEIGFLVERYRLDG
jgi:hypothetical protein